MTPMGFEINEYWPWHNLEDEKPRNVGRFLLITDEREMFVGIIKSPDEFHELWTAVQYTMNAPVAHEIRNLRQWKWAYL